MITYREPFDLVFNTVGGTPLVRAHASPDETSVYAKLESFNPGASVKDRIGKYMLERILESGKLPESGTIIESIAGNTGIGLAVMVGQLGIRTVSVVPERFSVERQTPTHVLRADVMNAPAEDRMGNTIDRVHKFADEFDDVVAPQQFSDPLNPETRYETTAPEVYDALDSEVGALIAGCGTADMLMGMTHYDRECNENIFVTTIEPERPLYARPHDRNVVEASYKTEDIDTHDPVMNELFDSELVDEFAQIADRGTHGEIQCLAAEESHLVASGAAANSLAVIDVAKRAVTGDLDLPYDAVATVFSDSSGRYLSKGVYGSFESWEG